MRRHRSHRCQAAARAAEAPVGFGWLSERQLLESMWDRCDSGAIYAAFTLITPGQGIVKIGMSQDPRKRLIQIRHGSPLPIREFLFAPTDGTRKAALIEQRIHTLFHDRRTRGEWFRFDYTKPTEKQFFHAVTKSVYEAVVGHPLEWRRVRGLDKVPD